MTSHATPQSRTPAPCARVLAAIVLGAFGGAFGALAGAPPIQTYYVPASEPQLYTFFTNVQPPSVVGTQIVDVIAMTCASSNTVIYFDHYEDGFETDIANPTQVTTQIWGDGVPGNGVAPGTVNDLLGQGSVVIMQRTNRVTVAGGNATLGTNILFGCRDKFASTLPIAATFAAWSVDATVNIAEGCDLYDTASFGTAFVSPVGTNVLAANQVFECSQFIVMPSQNGTLVRLDNNADGSYETTNLLNEGQSLQINGIKSGAQLKSDKPIQCHVFTGDKGSSPLATRWYTLLPTTRWDRDYYNPVFTTSASTHSNLVFLYSTQAVTVTITALSGTRTTNLAANATAMISVPTNGGQHIYAASNSFYAVLGVDVGAGGNANGNYDWGSELIPQSALAEAFLVGWAPGRDLTTASTVNANPVWVTAVSNTVLLVDYDGNPLTGALTDGNGNKYDERVTLGAFQAVRLYDTLNNDRDQTGTRVYTTNGVKIAAAYGEDPATAPVAAPGLDVGTTIQPLRAIFVSKTATITNDVNGNGLFNPGDQIRYSINVVNGSLVSIQNFVVLDTVPTNTTYILNSTQVGGVALPDSGVTPFPLDESGYTIAQLLPGQGTVITFRVAIPNPFPTTVASIVNTVNVHAVSLDIIAAAETPVALADLALNKVANTNLVVLGSNFTYTITLTNSGPAAGTGIIVTDALPAGVTFVSSSSADYVPASNRWMVETIAAAASTSLTLTAKATGSGTITNVAQVSFANETDPDSTPGNSNPAEDDQGSAVVTIQAPAASITKTLISPSGRPAAVGETFVFRLVVANTGTVGLNPVIVTDLFNTAFMTFSSAVPPASITNAGSVVWTNVGPLAVGGSVTITANFTAVSAGSGTNVAIVQPTTTNGISVAPQTSSAPHVAASASLALFKRVVSPTNRPAAIGEAVQFLIVITNAGPVPASIVPLTDTFHSNLLTFVSATPSQGAIAGNVLSWPNVGPLGIGASTNIYINFTARTNGIGTNVAVTTGSTNTVPHTNVNPRAQVSKTIVSPTGRPAAVGEDVLFAITVSNSGDATLDTVPVVDTYSTAYLAYVSANPASVDNANDGVINWANVGPILAGNSATITARFTAVQSGTRTNLVTTQPTTTNGVPVPPATTNAPHTASNPQYTIQKTQTSPAAGQSARIGETIQWAIVINNTGDVALQTVPVTDRWNSAYATFANAVPPPNSSAAGQLIWNNVGPLNAGASTTLLVTVTATNSTVGAGGTNVVSTFPVTPAGQPPVTAKTSSVPFSVNRPAVVLSKTVSLNGTCPGVESVLATNGALATYCLAVSNSGDVALSNVAVVDGTITPVFSNFVGTLAAGQVVNLQVQRTVSGSLTNAATVKGFDPDGDPVADTNTASVVRIAPAIQVAKTASANATFPGGELVQGTNGAPVTYWIVVSNAGDVTLTNVTLNDAIIGYTTNVGSLAAGQSKTVSVARTITADLTNRVFAAGQDPTGNSFTNNDTAAVDRINPAITIADTVSAGGTCPGVELVQGTNGTPVTYCFIVTNPGDVTLSNVVVTNAALNFSQAIGSLAPGQSVTVSVSTVISADLVNTAVVKGTDPLGNTVTANDPSAVDLIAPSIVVAKTANGVELAQGTNGAPVTYTLIVSNAGDVTLTNVTLNDAIIGYTTNVGSLAAGQSKTVSVARTITADLTNRVFAAGQDPTGNSLTNNDTAAVDRINPAITIADTVSAGGTCPGVELVQGTNGTPVTYCFIVTNPGDVTLSNVVVTNAALNFSQAIGSLAPGQSVTVSVSTVISADLVNTAVVKGTDPLGNTVTANDPSAVDLIAPSIVVAKTANGVELAQGTNGAPVTYAFVVSNAGDVTLTNVTLNDAIIGYTTNVGSLAAGQSKTVSVARTITADLTNRVFAAGQDPTGNSLTNNDTAAVDRINPAITIADTVSAAGTCPGVELVQGTNGTPVTYCFIVTNPGDVTLSNVVVTNAALNFSQAIGSLAPGQSVTVSVSTVISADLVNTAVVKGTDPLGNTVTANDPSAVDLIAPSIVVAKTANGVELAQGTNGAPVTYAFVVSNAGDVTLTNVTLNDAIIGYTTNVGNLAAGQSKTVSVARTITADLTNRVFAAGQDPTGNSFTNNDTAAVDRINPAITIADTVSAVGTCPGVELVQETNGTPVTYCFIVTNPGDVTLSNVVVTNAALNFSQPIGSLAPGQSVTVSVSTVISADLVNTAVVKGTDPLGNTITANDPSAVDLIAPSIAVAKTANGVELAQGTNGAPVTYAFVVSNAGDVTLTNVTLNDAIIGYTTNVGNLAAGQSKTVSVARTITADLTNVVVASGQDPQGGTKTSTDTAVVDLVSPGISIAKSVSDSLASPGVETVTGTNSQPVLYTFIVQNTGDVTLTSVALSDPLLIPPFTANLGTLTPGQTETLTATRAISGDLTNIATVVGQPLVGNPVTASDTAYVILEVPDVEPFGADVSLTKELLPIKEYPSTWTIPISKGQQWVDGDYWMRLEYGQPSFDVWGPGNLKADVAIDAKWHHVAGRFTRGPNTWGPHTMEILVDGQVVATRVTTGTTDPSTAPLFLGAYLGTNYYYGGLMDEVRLSRGARSDAWLQATVAQQTNAAFLALGAEEASALPGYASRRALTIDGSLLIGSLSNFPVLVNLTQDFLRTGVQTASGADLVFTTTDGQQLPAEVELFQMTAGRLVAWVQLPAVPAGVPTTFYLHYGNPAPASPPRPPSAVWDAGFMMVQHLEEPSGPILDSTVNGNNGTAFNAFPTPYGIADGAYEFNGTNAVIEIPDSPSIELNSTDFTIEAWYTRKQIQADALFELQVQNAGPETAVDLVVQDDLAPAFSLVEASASQGLYTMPPGLWQIGDLAAGSTATLHLAVNLTGSGQATNVAEVFACDTVDPDSTPGNGVPGEDDQAAAIAPASDGSNGPTNLPDFVVTSIVTTPTGLTTGGAFSVTVTVRNQGDLAGDAGQLRLWSDHPADAAVGEPGSADQTVGSLGAGESRDLVFGGQTAPASDGTYTLRAFIDADGATSEQRENNNQQALVYVLSSTPAVPGGRPDFVITSLATTPSTLTKGASFSVTVTVKNQGEAAGAAGQLRLWKNHFTPAVAGEAGDASQDAGSLAVGHSTTLTFDGLTAPTAAGTYTLRAFVDADGATAEQSEGNNQSTLTFTLQVPQEKPDFVVTSIATTPLTPGGTFTATVTIKNQGPVSGTAGHVRLWKDHFSSAAAGEVGDAEQDAGELAAGATAELVFGGLAAPSAAGTYNVRAFVDADNGTVEQSEGNNQKTLTFTFTAAPVENPDFTISDISFSPNPTLGGSFTAYVTVRNQGPVSGDPGYVDVWVDHVDAAFVGEIGDAYLAAGVLSAGEARILTFTVLQAPASIGTHTFRAFIDSRGTATEQSEGNNQKSKTYGFY